MAIDLQTFGIDRLTVDERLQLVDLIMESLPVVISEEQWAEIDRRCADADANPDGGTPWREALDRIEKSL